jgi:hypothetical protein
MQQYNQQQFMAPTLMSQQQSQTSFGTPAATAGTAQASFGISPFTNPPLATQQSVPQSQAAQMPIRSFTMGQEDMFEGVGDPAALMNELKQKRQSQKAGQKSTQQQHFGSTYAPKGKSSQQRLSSGSRQATGAQQSLPKNAKRVRDYYGELAARRDYKDRSEIDIEEEAEKPDTSSKWDKRVDDDAYEDFAEAGNTYAEDARMPRTPLEDEEADSSQKDDGRRGRGSRYETGGARRMGPAALYQAANTRPYEDLAEGNTEQQQPSQQSETERQLEALIDKKFEAGRERQRRDMQRQFEGFGGEASPSDRSTGRERQLQRHPFAFTNEPADSSLSGPGLRKPFKGHNEAGRPGEPREL